MTIAIWNSSDARIKWREVIDTAAGGDTDVVITQYGKPVVAVIGYADYVALQDALDDLRAARRADAIYAAYRSDLSSVRPWDEVRAELIAEGKLDGDE